MRGATEFEQRGVVERVEKNMRYARLSMHLRSLGEISQRRELRIEQSRTLFEVVFA